MPSIDPTDSLAIPHFWVCVVLSFILLIAALVIIISKRPPNEKHWAYGLIGTLLGFWLKW